MSETEPTKAEQPALISVELFQADKHYAAVAKWWTEQGWPVLPLTHLSGTGVVVSNNGAPVAATWIYKTDSAICWIEWIVASPEIRHELRSNVLSVLLSSATMLAKSMGFQSIFTSTNKHSLESRLTSHGFKATDRGVTQMIQDLSRRDK